MEKLQCRFLFFVQMNREFKQRPLKTMNEALQNAGRLLSRITPDRTRCLVAVTTCQPFITWLKQTIAGNRRGKKRIYSNDSGITSSWLQFITENVWTISVVQNTVEHGNFHITANSKTRRWTLNYLEKQLVYVKAKKKKKLFRHGPAFPIVRNV